MSSPAPKTPTPIVVRLTDQGTVTIPDEFRAAWDDEVVLEVVLRDDGVIELRPRVLIDPAQRWFWTARWQQMERETDEAIAAGRTRLFADVDGFLAALDE